VRALDKGTQSIGFGGTGGSSDVSSRPLVDFVVIGAYKSGTTALHFLLAQHPELFVPARKEPSFFAMHGLDGGALSRTGVRSAEEYQRLFMRRGADELAGEVSPAYLTVPGTASRLQAMVPQVQIIGVLRNPVDRAYSDYLMAVREGVEKRDFLEVLSLVESRDYLKSGLYAAQLTPYFSTFPRDQIGLWLFDDLVDNGASMLSEIFQFLGVDPDVDLDWGVDRNRSGVPRSRLMGAWISRLRPSWRGSFARSFRARATNRLDRLLLTHPPMPPAARSRLVEFFSSDVAATEQLIGRPLQHWLR
jgi:hypothetical protein